MAVHDLNLLTNKDLPEQWERAEYCRESRAAVDNPVWKVVDLDPVREISDASS